MIKWQLTIEEAIEKFFEDGNEETLKTILESWVDEVVSRQGYSAGFGKRKARIEEYIADKLIAILKKHKTRERPKLYDILKRVITKNVKIQLEYKHLPPESIPEEEKPIVPEPRKPTHKEIAEKVQEFFTLEGAVMKRKGGIFDYMKLLPRRHPLWMMAAIYGSDRLNEFALIIRTLSGQRITFPGPKKLDDARLRLFLRENQRRTGLSYKILAERWKQKTGLDTSIRKVAELSRSERKRKLPRLDEEVESRDFLSKINDLLIRQNR